MTVDGLPRRWITLSEESSSFFGLTVELEWQTLNGSLPLIFHRTSLMSPMVSNDTHLDSHKG